MKIAFVNIYQGGVDRGLETYVSEIAKRLKKHHKVDIFTSTSGPLSRWPVVWRAYLDPHGLKIALFTLKILPKIWREKYDFVFALNGGWQPAFIRIATWLYGGKMLISGQSGKGWDDRNNLWCFPDCFIVLTEDGKKWAKKVNPLVKVEIIPNGVDTDIFKPDGKIFKTGLTPPIVVCQGAAEPSKRLDLAIKAVAKLKNVSLLIVGKGSLSDEISAFGKKLLGERFKMISVTHDKMPSLYRAGNIFTLPSEFTEAFGIAYIEALASGLPVVATDNPVRREIVGEAGLFIDPTNIDKYAKAIQKTLNTNWKNKPRNRAKIFEWDNISQNYENLLNKLTG